jgi:quercetin dioxygenase-like cupin family protein
LGAGRRLSAKIAATAATRNPSLRCRRMTLLSLDDAETITRRELREVVILAARPELTVTWTRYAPGEPGPGLHVHRGHTDAFYVLEGELTFVVGPDAERLRMPAGSFVAVPPNVVHTYVCEAVESRWLNMHAPDSGFADYMRGLRDGTGVTFDQFEPPADDGLPPAAAIVAGPGAGERRGAALVKAALPELLVAEWPGPEPGDLDGRRDACFALGAGRVLQLRAPGDAR